MTTYLTMNKLSHRLSEQLFKTSRNSTQQRLCHHMNNIHITTPMAIHSLILGCFPCMAPFHHITIRVTSRHCQHILHLAVRLHHHPPVLHHPHPKQKTSNGGIFISEASQLFCPSGYLLFSFCGCLEFRSPICYSALQIDMSPFMRKPVLRNM